MNPFLLETKRVEKVWGRDRLPRPFGEPGEVLDDKIGEIWFDPPPRLDRLLAKYLFTSEKLSVQVHPSDAEAPEGLRGKEECWLILDAEPDAVLGIGLREAADAETLRAAAQDGSIEEMIDWHPVAPGDFFYLPAGTIHAIGPGLSLVEIQQNSDITYRLYDYGRPRELHLDEGLRVARPEPYGAHHRAHVDPTMDALLVTGPHFRLAQMCGEGERAPPDGFAGPALMMVLDGCGATDDLQVSPGEAACVDLDAPLILSENARLLVAQACG